MTIRYKGRLIDLKTRRAELVSSVYPYWDCNRDESLNPLDSPNHRYQDAYRFCIGVETVFWANSAERQMASDRTAAVCTSVLFEDVLKHIPRLKHAIYNQDSEEAMRIVDEMQSEMTW